MKKVKLRNIFSKMPNKSYPGRIYGMYKWNGKDWVIDLSFCKENNINVADVIK